MDVCKVKQIERERGSQKTKKILQRIAPPSLSSSQQENGGRLLFSFSSGLFLYLCVLFSSVSPARWWWFLVFFWLRSQGSLTLVCRRDIVPNPTFTTLLLLLRCGESLFSFWEKKERKKFATSPSVETRAGQSGNNAQPSTKALGNNT